MLGVASASEIARAATSGDTDARRRLKRARHDLIVLQAHADPNAEPRPAWRASGSMSWSASMSAVRTESYSRGWTASPFSWLFSLRADRAQKKAGKFASLIGAHDLMLR